MVVCFFRGNAYVDNCLGGLVRVGLLGYFAGRRSIPSMVRGPTLDTIDGTPPDA